MERPAVNGGLVLTCEHASAAVPPLVSLGVPAALLASHVAFDAGALDVARALAARTGAPLFSGAFTRLLVDLNRCEDSAEVVPAVAFGVPVPGNAALSAEGRQERIDRWWRPHRRAVQEAVDAAVRAAGAGRHLAVHSFTTDLDPAGRDFDVGVLFDPARTFESEWARRMAKVLSRAGFTVRENEPYAGTADGLTTALRGRHPDAAYAGVELELNQSKFAAAAIPQPGHPAATHAGGPAAKARARLVEALART